MMTCSKCLIEKILSEFEDKRKKGGYRSLCKDCYYNHKADENKKRCGICLIDKELMYFGTNNSSKDKLDYSCKDCISEKRKKEYIDNREEHLSINKIKRRCPANRFSEAKRRALKERNLEWTLSFEEYSELISKPCYYCNNLLGKTPETRAGLDRLDNSLGYIVDNCVSCCHICNRTKMHFYSPEETKAMIELVMKMRGII